MKITPKLLNELYELDNEYNINTYYEKAVGGTPQEKYTNMTIGMPFLPKEEKVKLLEYFYKYYSLIKGISIEKAEEIDFIEVKKEVNTFRILS